jgi:hypothetical protein
LDCRTLEVHGERTGDEEKFLSNFTTQRAGLGTYLTYVEDHIIDRLRQEACLGRYCVQPFLPVYAVVAVCARTKMVKKALLTIL